MRHLHVRLLTGVCHQHAQHSPLAYDRLNMSIRHAFVDVHVN